MKKNVKALTALALCSLLLSACGFHLQGKQELAKNFDNVYVLSDTTHSPITSEIILLFKTNNLNVVDSPVQADVIFHINNDKQSAAQIGSNTTQETRIYRMRYAMEFSLESPKYQLLYGPNNIVSTTTHYVYSGQVLGNNQEEEPIFTSLRRDTLQKLLLKLSSKDIENALEAKNETNP